MEEQSPPFPIHLASTSLIFIFQEQQRDVLLAEQQGDVLLAELLAHQSVNKLDCRLEIPE